MPIKKAISLFLFLYFSFTFGYCQSDKVIDSLINLSQNKKGIEKIKILEKLFDAQLQKSPEEAEKTANQVLDLSKKTEDKNIKVKAAKMQIIKYLDVVKNYDSTIIWSEKALSYLTTAKDSLSLIQVYQYLATSYYYKDYFDSATYFYIKSTEIAEVSNDEQELIKSYGSLANVYSLSQDFKTAQIYRKKAYLLAQKNNNINQQIKISFNISASYINQDELDSAIVYAKEAVFLSEKANFGIGLYRSLTKLSECYYKKGENEKALQTIEKSNRNA